MNGLVFLFFTMCCVEFWDHKRIVWITSVKICLFSSAGSQWAGQRRRGPDPPHGPDGMGGAGCAPVPVAPIQSQGQPPHRQTYRTPQCQYRMQSDHIT